MAKEITIINDIQYAQILQQAIVEIQTARTTIAQQVNRLYAPHIGTSASRFLTIT